MPPEALAKSTGYFNCPGGKGWLTGYLSFGVANTLLETGKYSVYRADCWGYILESKEKPATGKPPNIANDSE